MVDLSNEFRQLTAKIYTFAFLCLSVKLLGLTSLSQGGLKIELDNPELLSGALGLVTFLLTIAGTSKLVSDWMATCVADEEIILDTRTNGLLTIDLKSAEDREPMFSEKRFYIIQLASRISFAIEAVVPLLVGGITSWYAHHDMVFLIRKVST